ncbi:hypothetical protein OSTOST_19528, partial [Ostertagia ostertagi]
MFPLFASAHCMAQYQASTPSPAMYPNYEVYGNVDFAEAAKSRYNERSLSGLLSDVMMLSKCDYLVCTFSSHFCRVAYELMQVRRGDAGENFYSLDEDYYFGGQIRKPYHLLHFP